MPFLLTPVATAEPVLFDIPAQALDRALDAFSAASGFQVFYETSVTAGRHSMDVRGHLEREAALRLLLQESGLAARMLAADTITIIRLPETSPEMKRIAVSHYGTMQQSIMRALCDSPAARPGSYRAVVQFWSDATGRISDVRLIGSTGDSDRSQSIARALRAVVFGPGVRDIPQPVTMVIEPVAQDDVACEPHQRAGR